MTTALAYTGLHHVDVLAEAENGVQLIFLGFANAVDTVAVVALLTIGILSLKGVLPIASPIGSALTTAGVFFAFSTLFFDMLTALSIRKANQ